MEIETMNEVEAAPWVRPAVSKKLVAWVANVAGKKGKTAIEIIGGKSECLVGAAIARAVLERRIVEHKRNGCYPIYSRSMAKPCFERWERILTEAEKASRQRHADMLAAQMLVVTLAESAAAEAETSD